MHTKKSGFSLIELIVGISISLVLMVGVGVFITSGMKHLTSQSLMVEMQGSIDNSLENIENVFTQHNGVFLTGSQAEGVLLQTDTGLGAGMITFLGPKTVTGYCAGEPDLLVTKLALESFTPFEGSSGDLFLGFSKRDSSAEISSSGGYFSYGGKIYDEKLESPVDFVQVGPGRYLITDRGNHSIFSFDVTNPNMETWYGKGIPAEDVGYLNQPSGITSGENSVFIADTGNNRILSVGMNGENPKEVLNAFSGLNHPTGVYYTGGVLYIADTGNKRVLAYHSKSLLPPNSFDFEIIPTTTFDASEATLEIFSTTSGVVNLTQTGNISWGGTGILAANGVEYNFASQSFFAGVPTSVTISGVSGNLSATGSYYARLSLGGGIYVGYQPLFTLGDDLLETLGDNGGEIFATGLLFPTGIYAGLGGNIEINDFLQRGKFSYDPEGNFIESGALSPLSFENIAVNTPPSKISEFVIEKDSFSFKKVGNMLHVGFEYYSQYDCLDPTQNIKKNMIIKKELN